MTWPARSPRWPATWPPSMSSGGSSWPMSGTNSALPSRPCGPRWRTSWTGCGRPTGRPWPSCSTRWSDSANSSRTCSTWPGPRPGWPRWCVGRWRCASWSRTSPRRCGPCIRGGPSSWTPSTGCSPRPIRRGCGRCWSTSSRTPPGTPPTGAGSTCWPGPVRTGCCWRSPTMAPAFPARSGTPSSNGSAGVVGPTGEPVSGWPSPGGRWPCTAGRSPWSPRPGGAGSG